MYNKKFQAVLAIVNFLLLSAILLVAKEKPNGFVAGGSGTVNGVQAQRGQVVFASDKLTGNLTVKLRSGKVREVKDKNPNAVENVCDHVSESAREYAASPSVPASCP